VVFLAAIFFVAGAAFFATVGALLSAFFGGFTMDDFFTAADLVVVFFVATFFTATFFVAFLAGADSDFAGEASGFSIRNFVRSLAAANQAGAGPSAAPGRAALRISILGRLGAARITSNLRRLLSDSHLLIICIGEKRVAILHISDPTRRASMPGPCRPGLRINVFRRA
jgi:hypothetical protein